MSSTRLRRTQSATEGDPSEVCPEGNQRPSGMPAARLTANASSLRRETPSGESFGHATRTPVAYGGRPSCRAGITACRTGLTSRLTPLPKGGGNLRTGVAPEGNPPAALAPPCNFSPAALSHQHE
ncbi:MAG: hypothetical protein F6K28_02420 [Microcoleus sp. SIO2G3]|nr:hypothetical protein [Microcoleus sp. SIO2G3]